MKASTWSCTLAPLIFLSVLQLKADDLQLTLDLRNANRANAAGGGTWQLFARVIDTETDTDGSSGIAGIRALLDNVSLDNIAFNPAINPNGVASVRTLPGDAQGTIEIIYRQDLAQPTLLGVGVPPTGFPNRDVLIASGSWPPGPRPVFGSDGDALSSGEFLTEGGTSTINADSVPASIFTLGDMNRSATITSIDIGAFVARLPGSSISVPYDPAGDINQSGHISNLDIAPFVAIIAAPPVSPVMVPEPNAFLLVIMILAVAACYPGRLS